MQRASFSRKRFAAGIGLIIASIIFMDRVLYWSNIHMLFNDKILFLLATFMSSVVIGFGIWLMAGLQISMFAKPLIITTAWIFLVILPILLLPLSSEVLALALGSSTLIPILLYSGYVNLKKKRKKEAVGK